MNQPSASENERATAVRQRTRVRPPRLLLRNLSALDALIAVGELREISGLAGVDSDPRPGLTLWLFERVADVTYDRLPGRDRESVRRAPLS